MPKLVFDIQETEQSITRPVIKAVMKNLSIATGIPEDTPIHFLRTAIQGIQAGSSLDDQGDRAKLPFNNKFFITVTETYPEDFALASTIRRPDEIVIFADNAIDLRVAPSYQNVEIGLNISFRTHDRNTADLWMADMKRRAAMGKTEDLHEVSYHYPIPIEIMVFLDTIYQMREAVDGYGDTFADWLKEHFTEKMTVISNQAGNHPTFVIRENQIRVLGWYEFLHTPPEFDRENDAGSWKATFSYKFRFDRCEQMVLDHPYMVHNQLIPRRLRDDRLPYDLLDRIIDPSLSKAAFLNIVNQTSFPAAWRSEVGLRIPYYDDWYPKYQLPDTQSLMRIMLATDPDNPTHVINLENLTNWEWKPEALAYMKDTPMAMTALGESVFNLTIHRRWALLDTKLITINGDLDVLYATDNVEEQFKLREWYHLHVSLMTNLMFLTEAAKKRLGIHGLFTINLLKILDPTLEGRGLLPSLNDDGSINFGTMINCFQEITEKHINDTNSSWVQWRLVGTFFVRAQRR